MERERRFTVEYKGGSACSISLKKSRDFLASLKIKEWETAFFERKFGTLDISHEALLKLKNDEIHDILDSLVSFADESGFSLVELKCSPLAIELIPIIEEKGFRLVETQMNFLTLMRKPIPYRFTSDIAEIRFATEKDLEEILHLTHMSFTNNPNFLSRFKNRYYFTEQETERYYSAWIENHLAQANCRFVVAITDGKIVGFQSLQRVGLREGIPHYRPLISAVHPNSRGHNLLPCMFSFNYDHIPENEFYRSADTQLTNLAMINQLIKTQMTLKDFELIFFRLKYK